MINLIESPKKQENKSCCKCGRKCQGHLWYAMQPVIQATKGEVCYHIVLSECCTLLPVYDLNPATALIRGTIISDQVE